MTHTYLAYHHRQLDESIDLVSHVSRQTALVNTIPDRTKYTLRMLIFISSLNRFTYHNYISTLIAGLCHTDSKNFDKLKG